MKLRENDQWYISRRGELLAQEFLMDLNPTYFASLGSNIALDYIAFFSKENGSPIAIAIEVKATEQEINNAFFLHSRQLERYQHSNIPVLLVVVDVKRNEVFFNWINETSLNGCEDTNEKPSRKRPGTSRIQLRKSTPEEIEVLKKEILVN
jgi:hypothetical protein